MVSGAERVAGNGSSLEESSFYFEFKEYAQKLCNDPVKTAQVLV